MLLSLLVPLKIYGEFIDVVKLKKHIKYLASFSGPSLWLTCEVQRSMVDKAIDAGKWPDGMDEPWEGPCLCSVEDYCAFETLRTAANFKGIARARTEKQRRKIEERRRFKKLYARQVQTRHLLIETCMPRSRSATGSFTQYCSDIPLSKPLHDAGARPVAEQHDRAAR